MKNVDKKYNEDALLPPSETEKRDWVQPLQAARVSGLSSPLPHNTSFPGWVKLRRAGWKER